MTVPARLEIRDARPVPAAFLGVRPSAEAPGNRIPTTRAGLSTADLSFRVFAAFRAHPHINNVLTHISHSNWPQVERDLNVILDTSGSGELSPLAQNIVDLMCAERGITGRILKPYFRGVLSRLVEPHVAERLIRHIGALFAEIERKAKEPPVASVASVESVERQLP